MKFQVSADKRFILSAYNIRPVSCILLLISGGKRIVTHNAILSQFIAHDNDGILMKRFFDTQYIAIQSSAIQHDICVNEDEKKPLKRQKAGIMYLFTTSLCQFHRI